MARSFVKKIKEKISSDNERAARQGVLEDLFYDFNRSRSEVYKMNFVRGVFFGLGSVIGGTVIVTLAVWILSFFVQIPGIGKPFEQVQDSIQSSQESKK
jgi:hypothetical protein